MIKPNQIWSLNLGSKRTEVRVINIGHNLVPGVIHKHIAFATIIYDQVPCGEIGMKGVMPFELWEKLKANGILTMEFDAPATNK